jgi:hypothetical protein
MHRRREVVFGEVDRNRKHEGINIKRHKRGELSVTVITLYEEELQISIV